MVAALAGVAMTTAGSGPQQQLRVGRLAGGELVVPVGQVVAPVGRQVELPGLRPQAVALSPDGKLLATSGKTSELVLLDPADGSLKARIPLPNDARREPNPPVASANILQPDKKGQLSYTGLVFSPDGRRIYLSNVNGSVKVFGVEPNGTVSGLYSIALPPAGAPRRRDEIPAGLAVSADNQRLYVCGNLSNRLFEIEAASGKLLRTWDVGVAPYDVVLNGDRAYISNWGGRRPRPGELTGHAGRGTTVKVDAVRHIANEGSVSVIDLAANAVAGEVTAHLHACALALSPDRRHLVCANAGSDNLTVIDTRTNQVAETIWAKSSPADLLGAQPCALAFDADGRRLYAANGTQNAVAVIDFSPGRSKLRGLVPVGWFPGALVFDAARRQLCVANIKGLPAEPLKRGTTTGYNSHQYSGSLTLLPVPTDRELPRLTAAVYRDNGETRIAAARLRPRPNQPPRAVPERIGEPSLLKHVVYVIKENRTYDQVLGDVREGNGEPSLCVFGADVTPNQHQMVRDFVLLDNTYCCGICSADGHQWTDTGLGNDYLERSFAGWPRSYPDGMELDDTDSLAYASSGFIWDNALAHGVSIWDFGEFAMPHVRWKDPAKRGRPTWTDAYNEYLNPTGTVLIGSKPGIASLAPYLPTDYIGWDMAVPDVWRAQYIVKQIEAWDRAGTMPSLILICLPDDHTTGTSAGFPTPNAAVADNDLAFGRIVEALGRSRFWKDTVVFGIEDDPQAGWDHVSGYRTTAYCVSPYAKRRTTVSTMYSTVSLLRTIEQILGLPPMNQLDASATPMFDCFTDQPDFTPFQTVPNKVPLDQMNPTPKKISDRQLRRDAIVSAKLDLRLPDRAPEDVLNRILWRATKGTAVPYPTWAVQMVDDD